MVSTGNQRLEIKPTVVLFPPGLEPLQKTVHDFLRVVVVNDSARVSRVLFYHWLRRGQIQSSSVLWLLSQPNMKVRFC
jgi:hypothetical protein